MAIPDQANRLGDGADEKCKRYLLNVGDDETVQARAIVVASGARYRRLDVANLAQFEGSSVHYWASPIEARLCSGQQVALVGAGNSAGQAAVYLASHVKKVWLLARGGGLEASMSHYLVERIKAQSNIEVLPRSEITALEGHEGNLESVRWRNRTSGEEMAHPAISFCSSEPIRIRTGSRNVVWRWTRKALSGQESTTEWGVMRWKRIARVSSPSATCAQARSSGWLQPSEKAPRSWPRFMPISRKPAAMP
jgi:thioredoxin reductase (NADPH)